jgi:selenocysteine lyase/cysteine desulfurase
VVVPDPPLARRFLRLRGIVVTEKPEGLRIATHFFNDERDVDACVDALIEYRETVVAA